MQSIQIKQILCRISLLTLLCFTHTNLSGFDHVQQANDHYDFTVTDPGSNQPRVYNQFLNKPTGLQKGILLIASNNLNDPVFGQSVILLTRYDERGTTGLIINKPIAVTLEKLLPQLKDIIIKPGAIKMGGPIAMNFFQLLVRSDSINAGSSTIIDEVFIIDSVDEISGFINQINEYHDAHIYFGYSGWAPGQLESELLRGDWYLGHADINILFQTPAEQIWPELINSATNLWAYHQ